jgi:hypothetical protein
MVFTAPGAGTTGEAVSGMVTGVQAAIRAVSVAVKKNFFI